MKTVLITGATGFLGHYLVREFGKDYRVLALGRNRDKAPALEALGATFCKGDFANKAECRPFFKGVDCVIHAGALSTVWGPWDAFYRANVQGTRNVAELCVEAGVKRLVYVSSPSIYSGRQDRLDIREAAVDPENRLNGYIRSKLLAEALLEDFCRKGLYTVVLRPRGLVGPGDTSLAPRILETNRKTGIPLFREGKNLVDLTCVENVAYGCRLCAEAPDICGEAFNLTNGEPMAFRRILELFLDAVGERPRYLRLPLPVLYGAAAGMEGLYTLFRLKGEPRLTRYTVCTLGYSQTLNIDKARGRLGYRPRIGLEEGIRNYGRLERKN